MNYWVIKGNPKFNDWDKALSPGATARWHSGRVPKVWQRGDRLFCWESTPGLRLIGLAELGNTNCGYDENGDRLFRVKYLTKRLRSVPTISELRKIAILKGASFLKTGPATTLFPLKVEQGKALFTLLARRNPAIERTWRDVCETPSAGSLPDLDLTYAVTEGKQRLIMHLRREKEKHCRP